MRVALCQMRSGDDVESNVFARFSAKVYSGHQITNPAGLLVRMIRYGGSPIGRVPRSGARPSLK
jgi:hypothetical protein